MAIELTSVPKELEDDFDFPPPESDAEDGGGSHGCEHIQYCTGQATMYIDRISYVHYIGEAHEERVVDREYYCERHFVYCMAYLLLEFIPAQPRDSRVEEFIEGFGYLGESR